MAEIRNPVRSVPYLLSNSLVELDISNTGINSLEGIQIYTRLEKLLAADNQLTNISQLTGPYGPLPLEELDLSNNSLSNISELTNFNELLLLNVSGNSAIDFMQLQQVINQNSGLARLGMAGVPINYPGVPHLYDLFQTLIELDVSDTGITSLSGIEQYSELKVLRAAGNQLVDISSLATVGYFGALDLEVLDLSNNKIINIDPINTFTGLTSLDLSGNNDIDFSQVEFLLNQNLNIERLGIADITINVPNIPFVIQNLSHRLVELDLSRTGIVDIAGIESFQKLEALYLAGNKIQDLSPLTALNDPLLVNQSLRELDLSDNQLVDLAALNGFNRLSSLNLSSNSNIDYVQVEALLNQNIHLEQLGLAGINLNSPFMPMSVINLSQTMVELDLSSTGLQMIDGVEQFKNLKVLKLSDNQIQNLNSLINSNELLNHLDMSYNQITDISSGLNYYYNLKVLNLSGNTGIDYGQLNPVLNQNTGLKSLGVAGIPVNSSYIPSSVMNLENTLVELDMSTSSLYGVYGLEYFAKLKILKLAGNQIQDISPLSQMPMYTPPNQLRQLDLAGNNIQDIAPLTGFNGLTVLDLSGNARVDYFLLEQVITQNPGLERLGLAEIFVNSNSIPLAITNLAANLVELNMNNTGLQDIYGIEQFQKLEILKLAGNYIFDINPLASLSSVGSMQQSLQVLDLSDNQIVDVSPIQGFIGLNELNLSGNAGIDFSQVDLILNQNLSLERLGLAGIRVNSPDIPLTVTNLGTSLVELDMSNAGLQGVYGIEQLMYLEVLKLANNNIHDILPISSFAVPMKQKLRELDLSNNQITDIAALQDLNILRVLNLSGNNVIDYIQLESILYQNPGLERLGLADIKVNSPDIPSAITNLAASLLELDMSNTGLQEVYGIDQFDKLEILKLANNNIWNLNSVADLARDLYVPQQLRELDLSNNLITDVSALVGFNGLTALNLSANTGIDYLQLEPILIQNPGLVRLGLAGINVKSPLIPLAVLNLSQSLAELDMSNSGLQDIFGIEQLQKLETLNLAGNNISDIAPLSQMPVAVFGSLRELDLKNNSIVDIGPLVSYRNLEALNLSGNTGIDYNLLLPVIQQNTQLKKLGLGGIAINGPFPVYYDRINNPYQLTKLDLSNTGIIDLWGVEHYPDLDSLNVSGNNLTNIDALGMFGPLRVSFLRDLDLSNNAIMDVAPLSGFVNLESLWLSGNPDIDYQQLYGILDQNNQLTRIGLGDIAINGPIPQFMNQMTWQPYDLVELDLSNTGLTDVVGLEQYDELLSLDISGNGIQDITHLAYIPNYLLQRISLANNDIADIGPLYTLTQLNYIDLTGNNRISCIVLDELVMAFPEATIIRPTSCMIGYAPELFILHLHDGFFVIEGQMFELIADAFDPENGDLSAQVQWSSDVAGVLGTGNLLNVQLLQPGLHTITARVTDLDNNTVTQSVQITVIENVAPAVNISFPYDGFREIESIVMHTSANAYDNEDGALDHSIQWTSSIDGLVGTGGPVDLNLSVGDHVLTATVTDAFGKSASQSVNVTIIFNNPPELTILNPGPGTTTLEGTETILDASAFDIESGTLTDVIWQSNMQGNLGTGMHVVANLSVGVHTITASVTDHLGKTTTQTISHEVVFNNPPSLTITDPVNGSSVIEGQHAEFTASALDVEEGDLSANIIWSSNLVGQFGTGPFVSVPLTVGNHIITATVIDVQFKTTTQTVNHTVVFNNPPVVTINNPLNNTSIIEGTSISLSASVLDVEDGDLSTTTRWSSDIQGYLGTGSQLPVNLQVGIHTISATAMDDLNKTTTQSAVLTVAFNNPPALTLATGINGGNSEAGLAVQLSATVLDTESGDLGSVIAWSSDVSGSLGVGANLSVMLPTGPHTLIASVIDPHGKSHTLTAPYTVVDAPVLAYCDASASNTNREWIESISVSGITNNSGSQMGYGDFWNLGPIYLERAGNSISLTPGYSSNSRNEYWKIWIDYNRDGVFAGNELVVSDSGVGTLTRSFTLPADAVTGNTRMRVVMKPRQPGNACGSYRRGEVEDYRIIIQP
ncbi:MAG: leucine-rich repeat domain-containing protein [Gammaproteobacteria bacterium]